MFVWVLQHVHGCPCTLIAYSIVKPSRLFKAEPCQCWELYTCFQLFCSLPNDFCYCSDIVFDPSVISSYLPFWPVLTQALPPTSSHSWHSDASQPTSYWPSLFLQIWYCSHVADLGLFLTSYYWWHTSLYHLYNLSIALSSSSDISVIHQHSCHSFVPILPVLQSRGAWTGVITTSLLSSWAPLPGMQQWSPHFSSWLCSSTPVSFGCTCPPLYVLDQNRESGILS